MALKDRIESSIEKFMLTRSKAAAVGAFLYPSSMSWSGKGTFASIAPRNFPYYNADPLANSAVVNTLAWIQRNFGQARLQLEKESIVKGKKQEDEILEHPFLDLIWEPNAHYSYHTLWAATLLSYHLDGNAYWLKARNARGFGIPTELWYEPHWSIKPHYPNDGSMFIDYYERYINGTIQKIPAQDVVHFRNGLNPANSRYGLAPLKAALLQVFTDDEVSLWVAALCKNMAIPGVIVSPEQTISLGKNGEKAEQIKQAWKRKFGGDNRGEPLILDFAADVTTLGFNPSDMDFTAISNKAESRISGAMGVPAIVAGLSVGMDASTYNNLANLKKSAFEECLEPCWEAFETELQRQLLPDFTKDKTIEVCFETKHIRALQENETERQKRERDNFLAGAMTLNEFRECINLEPDPLGEYYIRPAKSTEISAERAAKKANEEPAPVAAPAISPAKSTDIMLSTGPGLPTSHVAEQVARRAGICMVGKKNYSWEGMDLSREPTDLEKQCIKAIAVAMEFGKKSLEQTLMQLRDQLIADAEKEIVDLDPESYHSLLLHANADTAARVKLLVDQAFLKGRALVRAELATQRRIAGKATPADEIDDIFEDDLLTIAKATITRVINELAARAVEIAGRLLMLLGRDKMLQAFRKELEDTKTGYIDNAAAGAINAAMADGRKAEWEYNKDEFGRVIYSAVLDTNTCGPCEDADGLEADTPEGLPDVPNVDCLGGPLCRCLHIYILKTEA